MGDVTGSGVINDMVNSVTVGGKSPEAALVNGQKRLDELVARP